MPTDNLLNAETKNFGDIMSGDYNLRVPIFQRDYSWDEQHWDDLWSDIFNTRQEQSKHYMGSIVLISREKKIFDVIDGQQRLTTLSLLILAVVKNIKDLISMKIDVDNNKKRVELIMNQFIGKKSLQSLNFTSKIALNEENDPFYSTYLIQFRLPSNTKSLSSSNKLLFSCFRYFEDKIRIELLGDNEVDKLIEFVEYIADNLVFVQIAAANDLSAYLIFETLNDRGLDLSVTDLLKNYLFSLVNFEDHKHVKNLWNEILKSVKYNQFPKFLRHFWMSKNKVVLEKDLFKVVKRNINSPEKAFSLLEELHGIAPIYAALDNERDSLWVGNEKAKKYIQEISLFNVKQCFPLMLISYLNLPTDEWVKVFRMCVIISFRYNTISGLNPNILEEVYNTSSIKVAKGESTKAQHVFNDLKGVYIDDESFIESFSKKIISTKRGTKLVRYILYNIENHINESRLDYLSDNGTIEHILPENPDANWELDFPQDIQESFIYRLGNYTILEEGSNRKIGNKKYEDKLIEYKKSSYKMTKDIDWDTWRIESINKRQNYLAKKANSLWKLNY